MCPQTLSHRSQLTEWTIEHQSDIHIVLKDNDMQNVNI